MIAAAAIAATLFNADVHGSVVSVDRAHNLVVVHHHAHEGMAMDMMMAVKMRDRHALDGLRKGQYVRLRCDARANPQVCVKR